MKKIIFILLLTFYSCNYEYNKKKDVKSSNEALLLVTLLNYNFYDECVNYYTRLNPLYDSRAAVFPSYNGAKVLWIGDSTIDFSRNQNDFITSLSDNRAIGGNTACDFLNQIRSASIGYETLIVASSDGNGILEGVSSEISIKTLTKVYNYGKDVLKVKNIVVVGVHPIKLKAVNERKNAVNTGIKQVAEKNGYCYIDMVALFGKTESDLPDDSQMFDNIHYSASIYSLLKAKIKSQCGISI